MCPYPGGDGATAALRSVVTSWCLESSGRVPDYFITYKNTIPLRFAPPRDYQAPAYSDSYPTGQSDEPDGHASTRYCASKDPSSTVPTCMYGASPLTVDDLPAVFARRLQYLDGCGLLDQGSLNIKYSDTAVQCNLFTIERSHRQQLGYRQLRGSGTHRQWVPMRNCNQGQLMS